MFAEVHRIVDPPASSTSSKKPESPPSADIAIFGNLQFAELIQMDFVGSIGQSQEAVDRKKRSDRSVVRNPQATVNLNSPVDDGLCHAGHDTFDRRNQISRLLIANSVHCIGRFERE